MGSTQRGGTRRRTPVIRLLGKHLIAVFSIVIALLVATGGVVAAYASLSATGQGQSQAKTLGAPTGLTTNGAPTSTKIKIKWTAPTTPTPSGYVVYRCTGAGCTPTSANTISSGG